MPKKTKEEKNQEEEKVKKYRELTADDITSRKDIGDRGKTISNREHRYKMYRLALILCLLFLIVIYYLIKLYYTNSGFVIGLARDEEKEYGIVLFEKLEDAQTGKNYTLQLNAGHIDYIDNISVDWIPKTIDDESNGGSHNLEDNYLAYTFYLANKGTTTISYFYTIYIDDVIKNVDDAMRIMIYHNGERSLYGKRARSGNAEYGTIPFLDDNRVCLVGRHHFDPGTIDKFTIVIFIEGDDPECLDPLIGGEMKMHMEIQSERNDRDQNVYSNEVLSHIE